METKSDVMFWKFSATATYSKNKRTFKNTLLLVNCLVIYYGKIYDATLPCS